MICKSCGAEVPNGYRVCTNCGASIETEIFDVEKPANSGSAKVMGIISIVVAIINLFVPLLCGCLGNLGGLPIAIIGIVLGVISAIMGSKKTIGIVAIILNIVTPIIGMVLAAIFTALLSQF